MAPDPRAAHLVRGRPVARQPLTLRLRTGALYPVTTPPIRQGALLIENGRIVALGPDAAVPRPGNRIDVDLPDAVVLPGLINVHTHLELTSLGRLDQAGGFSAWIRRVRSEKSRCDRDDFVTAARQGLRDMWRQGITTVADTGDSGATAIALSELGGRGVYYQEVFGPDPRQAMPALQGLEASIAALRDVTSELVTIGVSPHAPYSVSESLYQLVAAFARRERLPVAVHIAESIAEVDLVVRGSGDFAMGLATRGVPLPERAPSPVQYLDRCGALDVRPLAIHVVQANRTDVELLKRMDCSVACCPLSNRAHGHGDPPLPLFVDAGLRFGLGTDSVASVGTTDLRAEALVARALMRASGSQILRLLTLDGAQSIGIEDSVGSLDIGKFADLCVLSAGGVGRDDRDAPLAGEADEVLATFVAGRCVYQREAIPGLPAPPPDGI